MVQYPGNITRAACAVLISCILASPASAQEAGIKIIVQEGQGAINNIPQRRAKEPVVQVQHEDGEPVVGATVTFLLPDSGPGGTFADGARMLNLQIRPRTPADRAGVRLRPRWQRRSFRYVERRGSIAALCLQKGAAGRSF